MYFVCYQESCDEYEPGDLAGVSQPEDTTAQFFNDMLGQTVVESQPGADDDLLAGSNLVSLPHQVYTWTKMVVNSNTKPSRKRAHGWCTLHWPRWVDIQGISVAFRHEKAPR